MKEFEQKWLIKLETIIEKNLSEPTFYLTDLVTQLSVSSSTLNRKIKELTQLTPKAYIRDKRLKRAKELLESGIYSSVAEVALAVGFQHVNHFSILYEKKYGIKPSRY